MSSYALKTENREEMIVRYLPLVKYIANRIMISKPTRAEIDDLISYGIIGLIDAVDKFDPDKGVKFETYASLRIKGAIIDELRKLNWMPRTAVARITKLNETRETLKERLGREPSECEVAASMGVAVSEIRKIEGYVNYLSMVSLEDIIFKSGDEDIFLSSTIEDTKSPRPDRLLEDKEKLSMLKRAIDMLEEKDKIILNLYYYEKLTLKEIGCVLGVSESRVCQIHSRAILRLRDNFKKLNYQ